MHIYAYVIVHTDFITILLTACLSDHLILDIASLLAMHHESGDEDDDRSETESLGLCSSGGDYLSSSCSGSESSSDHSSITSNSSIWQPSLDTESREVNLLRIILIRDHNRAVTCGCDFVLEIELLMWQ